MIEGGGVLFTNQDSTLIMNMLLICVNENVN